MNIKSLTLKIALCITTLLCQGTISAADLNDSVRLSLKVKPHLCLRYAQTQSCNIEILINWASSISNNFCLHSSQDTAPIKCWRQSTGADHTELRVIDSDLNYWLSYENDSKVLIAKTVQIATIVNNEKRKQRSRRHIWSLI